MTPHREFQVGEIYHVMNRGVEKRKIFLTQQDYARFVLALYYFNDTEFSDIWTRIHSVAKRSRAVLTMLEREAKVRVRIPIVEILTFTLMPNHFHLVLREIKEGGVSRFMQKIGGYVRYFNEQHDRVGPLFQGRFQAVRVKEDAHLNHLFTYVHANAVSLVEPNWKEGRVQDVQKAMKFLEDYRWSSLGDFMGTRRFPGVVNGDFYLNRIGGPKGCRKVVREWVRLHGGDEDASVPFEEGRSIQPRIPRAS